MITHWPDAGLIEACKRVRVKNPAPGVWTAGGARIPTSGGYPTAFPTRRLSSALAMSAACVVGGADLENVEVRRQALKRPTAVNLHT